MEKPESVKKIEKFIKESKPKRMKLEDRVHFAKMDLPKIKYQGKKTEASKKEKEIEEAKKEMQDLEEQIQGAREALELEINKWIDQEVKELEQQVEDLEKQAVKADEDTEYYKGKIKEINGRGVTLLFEGSAAPEDGALSNRLRWRAKAKKNQVGRVAENVKNRIEV